MLKKLVCSKSVGIALSFTFLTNAAQPQTQIVTKNALDVVTHVRELQALIKEYIGNVGKAGEILKLHQSKVKPAQYMETWTLHYVNDRTIEYRSELDSNSTLLCINQDEIYFLIGDVCNDRSARAYSDDRRYAIFVDKFGKLILKEGAKQSELEYNVVPTYGYSYRHGLAFYPDGSRFALTDHKLITIWETITRKRLHTINCQSSHAIAYSPDKKYLVFEQAGDIEIRDALTHKFKRRFKAHAGTIYALAYFANGSYLISSAIIEDTVCKVWDGKTGKLLQVIPKWATAFARSPDGQFIAMGHVPEISIWSMPTLLEWSEEQQQPVEQKKVSETKCTIL